MNIRYVNRTQKHLSLLPSVVINSVVKDLRTQWRSCIDNVSQVKLCKVNQENVLQVLQVASPCDGYNSYDIMSLDYYYYALIINVSPALYCCSRLRWSSVLTTFSQAVFESLLFVLLNNYKAWQFQMTQSVCVHHQLTHTQVCRVDVITFFNCIPFVKPYNKKGSCLFSYGFLCWT